MILETYQEEKAIEPQEENNKAYGTITAVTEAGINVLFDGETEASTKPFYCNSGISYKVGDRVLLEKINGGYLIVCTVGKEGTEGGGETVNVVDDLNSTSATDALSANQGRVLKGMIPNITVVDNLNSTSATEVLSANQGRVLKGMIPSNTSKTHTVSSGTITAQKSINSYFSISAMKFLTGFYSSNANIYVNAYQSGSYVYWRAFNISTSSQSGTLYFSYVE